MYGRKYMGIQRATFVIGPDGKLQEGVSEGHAQERTTSSCSKRSAGQD